MNQFPETVRNSLDCNHILFIADKISKKIWILRNEKKSGFCEIKILTTFSTSGFCEKYNGSTLFLNGPIKIVPKLLHGLPLNEHRRHLHVFDGVEVRLAVGKY